MLTPSEAITSLTPAGPLSVPVYVSWADQERDLSAWLGNAMQRDAFDSLVNLYDEVKGSGNPKLLKIWRYLQTSDHFYYMSTKKDDDGNVHSYFSPYSSPYEAFINYMNVLSDFLLKIETLKVANEIKSGQWVKGSRQQGTGQQGSGHGAVGTGQWARGGMCMPEIN